MMADLDSTFHILPHKEHTPSRDVPARVQVSPGVLAGEYVLKAVLASGGHGAVYEAEHRILGRRAAVKVLHPHLTDQGEMLQRFVREARVVNQIRHPHIVDVYDFGMLPDGSPYYVMELLPGRTLSQLLHERGRLSPERALAFLEPVCEALEAAHRAGVVHRDLKASNVAVVSEGEPPVVKLLDFGIAKFIHPEPGQEGLTIAGQRLGTSQAMAPEQFRSGSIGPTTDVYALGVLLYQMLTGHYPFQSDDRLEVERMHLEAPPPRPSTEAPVPPAVDAVVLRCLEKEAEHRYPDVDSFRTALREAVLPASTTRLTAISRSVRAFALHAEVVIEEGAEDDAAYTTVSEVLDGLEQDLRAAGFVLAVQTGMALLGVRPLDEPPRTGARELLETAHQLHERAQARARGTRVSVRACVHVGQVDARRGPEGIDITGGPLADIAGWVVRDTNGLGITPAAARA
ncbi:serine/threonine-protein kinase [Cystobacter fuscus]|uniref:serine/threonine-protein kinase n=1 Tax=Cystobacter fuscus TaxID=43 RepID=UPI000BB389E9|nr:serine/threonine-protein kinase [Cystobacter fuscus]